MKNSLIGMIKSEGGGHTGEVEEEDGPGLLGEKKKKQTFAY